MAWSHFCACGTWMLEEGGYERPRREQLSALLDMEKSTGK